MNSDGIEVLLKVLEALSKDFEGDIHFVEDRYETLVQVSKQRELNHVHLYLVGVYSVSK